jgi:imidazolonepropionase
LAQKVDLLVYGARQLLTLAGKGPRCGKAMSELGMIVDGAVAIASGRIVATGSTSAMRSAYQGEREIDARGRAVLPGFVDAHTHPVFAGSRQDEFERRIAGATYSEIMAGGGGKRHDDCRGQDGLWPRYPLRGPKPAGCLRPESFAAC